VVCFGCTVVAKIQINTSRNFDRSAFRGGTGAIASVVFFGILDGNGSAIWRSRITSLVTVRSRADAKR
jgi:hypothetical protein